MIELTYLAGTSRVLARPVSPLIKGPSGSGKSVTTERTLRLFPEDAKYVLTAASSRALVYGEEPISHKVLVIYEATPLNIAGRGHVRDARPHADQRGPHRLRDDGEGRGQRPVHRRADRARRPGGAGGHDHGQQHPRRERDPDARAADRRLGRADEADHGRAGARGDGGRPRRAGPGGLARLAGVDRPGSHAGDDPLRRTAGRA